MKCGPVELLCRRREARQLVPEDDAQLYLENLAVLARLLRGLPWMLAGGLSIPLTLGSFYRRHRDVDIVFPMAHFRRVDEAMRNAGYRLVRRFSLSHRAHRMDLRISLRASSLLVKLSPRRLVFTDPSRASGPQALISTICVYPYRETERHFETCDCGHRFEKVAPVGGCAVELPGGLEVNCLNLHYVVQLKALRSGRTHRLDLTVIERGVEAAQEWFEAPAEPLEPALPLLPVH